MKQELEDEKLDLLQLKAHVKHIVKQLKIREPNLTDKINIIKEWHKSVYDENELVTRNALVELFLKIGLAAQPNLATQIMEQRLKNITSEQYVNVTEF